MKGLNQFDLLSIHTYHTLMTFFSDCSIVSLITNRQVTSSLPRGGYGKKQKGIELDFNE